MRKIYAVENNPRHLLLVDTRHRRFWGDPYVINGSYRCTLHDDGSLTNGVNDIKAYYVMDAPGRDDTDAVLEAAERILTSEGEWSVGPNGDHLIGGSDDGCGVFNDGDGWECNIVIPGEIIGLGPYDDLETAKREAVAEWRRRRSDYI